MKAKKLLAGVLTCTMVFAMGMTAFAADETVGNVNAEMKKSYKLENEGTVSPAETFKFKADCSGVTDAADTVKTGPVLTIAPAVYTEQDGATKDGNIKTLAISHKDNFPSVGIYTYRVTETEGNTAGVTYDTKEKTLVVTVTQGDNGLKETYALHDGEALKDNKTDRVENTYSAGNLTVTKEVAGNLGDTAKKFDFTVKFTKPKDKNVKSTITAIAANGTEAEITPEWNEEGTYTYTFKLSDGESATFKNIPYGVTYKVSEEKADYDPTIEGKDEGTVNAAEAKVTFQNTKEGSVDTGINLTTLPYMLTIAAIFVIAAIAFVAKRRRFED